MNEGPNFWILWDVVNIGLPLVLTPLLFAVVISFRTTDPRYDENASPVTVFKDGQLGFVTIPMAIALMMDMIGKVLSIELLLCWVVLLLCGLFGSLIAALGCVYTTDRKKAPQGLLKKIRFYKIMWLSVVFAGGTAAATHYARWHLL